MTDFDPVKQEPRQRLGRIVLLVAFAGAVLWGARLYQNKYPVGFRMRYVYSGLPDAEKLESIRATLKQGKRVVSVIRFFHSSPLNPGAPSVFREHRVYAPRGNIRVMVELRYKGGVRRTLQRKLQIKESGGVYRVHLRYSSKVR